MSPEIEWIFPLQDQAPARSREPAALHACAVDVGMLFGKSASTRSRAVTPPDYP